MHLPPKSKRDPKQGIQKGPELQVSHFSKHQRHCRGTKSKLLTYPAHKSLQTLVPATSPDMSCLSHPVRASNVLFLLCFQVSDQAEPLPPRPSRPSHLATSCSSFRAQTLLPLGSFPDPKAETGTAI